jgi:hypothetical protein
MNLNKILRNTALLEIYGSSMGTLKLYQAWADFNPESRELQLLSTLMRKLKTKMKGTKTLCKMHMFDNDLLYIYVCMCVCICVCVFSIISYVYPLHATYAYVLLKIVRKNFILLEWNLLK